MKRLRDAWRILNLSCQGMSHIASESLDRDVRGGERLALQMHVLYCTSCRRFLRQITFLRSALRRFVGQMELGDDLPGPPLPDDLRERITRALRDG